MLRHHEDSGASFFVSFGEHRMDRSHHYIT